MLSVSFNNQVLPAALSQPFINKKLILTSNNSQNRRLLIKRCKISAELQVKEKQDVVVQNDLLQNVNLENLPLPPTKGALPIFGHTLKYLKFSKLLKFLSECRADFGDIFCVQTNLIFGNPSVYIYDIDSILYLLGQEHNLVGPGYSKQFLKMMGSQNVLVLKGKEHLKNKQIMYKAFSNEAISNYLPVIVKILEKRSLKWSEQNGAVDLRIEGKNLIFEIAISIVLGKEFSEQKISECANLFSQMVDGIFGIVMDYPGSRLRKAYTARDQLVTFIQTNMKEILSEFEQGSKENTWINIYMNSLVNAGQKLNINDLSETSVAVLFAALTTTSNALLLLNYHILKHPSVFQQLQLEQSQIVQEFGQEISVNTLQKMTFADKVIREVLRVSPIVPVIPRVALKDFELKGFKIPKGWNVQLCAGRVMFEDWKDSWKKFDPSRWEEVSTIPKGFIPFGAGVRSCVGMQLALIELKVYLALIVRNYDVELIGQQDLPSGSFQIFQEGLFIEYSKRQ